MTQFVEYANDRRIALDHQRKTLHSKISNFEKFEARFVFPDFIREYHQRNSSELVNYSQVKNYFDEQHVYFWSKTSDPTPRTPFFNFLNNFLMASSGLSRKRLEANWKKSPKHQKAFGQDLEAVGLKFEDLLSICADEKEGRRNAERSGNKVNDLLPNE
jgi:hypothetical protein